MGKKRTQKRVKAPGGQIKTKQANQIRSRRKPAKETTSSALKGKIGTEEGRRKKTAAADVKADIEQRNRPEVRR